MKRQRHSFCWNFALINFQLSLKHTFLHVPWHFLTPMRPTSTSLQPVCHSFKHIVAHQGGSSRCSCSSSPWSKSKFFLVLGIWGGETLLDRTNRNKLLQWVGEAKRLWDQVGLPAWQSGSIPFLCGIHGGEGVGGGSSHSSSSCQVLICWQRSEAASLS